MHFGYSTYWNTFKIPYLSLTENKLQIVRGRTIFFLYKIYYIQQPPFSKKNIQSITIFIDSSLNFISTSQILMQVSRCRAASNGDETLI